MYKNGDICLIHSCLWRFLSLPNPVKARSESPILTFTHPPERHVTMSWAQRLNRVFNIDIDVCDRCGGSVKVIACIEDQHATDSILAHLREKEQDLPSLLYTSAVM